MWLLLLSVTAFGVICDTAQITRTLCFAFWAPRPEQSHSGAEWQAPPPPVSHDTQMPQALPLGASPSCPTVFSQCQKRSWKSGRTSVHQSLLAQKRALAPHDHEGVSVSRLIVKAFPD